MERKRWGKKLDKYKNCQVIIRVTDRELVGKTIFHSTEVAYI